MSSQQPCLPVPKRHHKKRKWQQQQQPEEDAVAVPFDDIQSMSASEYLGRVVEQARHIPAVMVSDKPSERDACQDAAAAAAAAASYSPPIEGSAASLHYLVSNRTALAPPPPRSASREWVDGVLESFSRLRDYLEDCRLAGVGGKQHRQHKSLPRLRDGSGWHVFCLGHKQQQHHCGEHDEQESESTDEQDLPAWKQNLPATGYPPTTALLLQMDQVMVRRVLGHLVRYYINVTTRTQQEQHGSSSSGCGCCYAWLYALLARLDRPVHRDDAAVLYSLLKQLSVARVKLCRDSSDNPTSDDTAASTSTTDEGQQLACINLLMVIVGMYFEQGGGYEAIMGKTTTTMTTTKKEAPGNEHDAPFAGDREQHQKE